MKFVPTQHGHFQIRWHGDVMIVDYFDRWNEVTARKLLEQALPTWQRAEISPGDFCLMPIREPALRQKQSKYGGIF